jgi:hypothetical protein
LAHGGSKQSWYRRIAILQLPRKLSKSAFGAKLQDFPYWTRVISPDWAHCK